MNIYTKTRSDPSEKCSNTATQANWEITYFVKTIMLGSIFFLLPLFSIKALKLFSLHCFLNFKIGPQLQCELKPLCSFSQDKWREFEISACLSLQDWNETLTSVGHSQRIYVGSEEGVNHGISQRRFSPALLTGCMESQHRTEAFEYLMSNTIISPKSFGYSGVFSSWILETKMEKLGSKYRANVWSKSDRKLLILRDFPVTVNGLNWLFTTEEHK